MVVHKLKHSQYHLLFSEPNELLYIQLFRIYKWQIHTISLFQCYYNVSYQVFINFLQMQNKKKNYIGMSFKAFNY